MGLTNRDKAVPEEGPPPKPVSLSDQELALHRWRYTQARQCGFTWREAKLFASSRIDLEEMRALARKGCSPDLIFKILL